MASADGSGDLPGDRKSPSRSQYQRVGQEDKDQLQKKDEEQEDLLHSQEWERRLMTGDLPDDFLQVTEPKGKGGLPPGAMATNQAFVADESNGAKPKTDAQGD